MERTAYNYGDDTPAAWDVLARGALGRPISTRISPVLFLEELNEVLLFAPPVKARLGQRPKPAGPGKTKALAASSVERPEETERRRAAQNDCRRLILPRTADEASDVFLRRLDAHRNAPEALVAPLSKPEDTKSFLRRMVAVKKNEAAGLLVMPRAKAETAEQFEARMALCEACPATVFARGAHEDPTDFKARLDAQSKCRRPIMCRSDGEAASLFRRRCAVSRACLDVVHPYDAARESADDFTRRMDAQEAAPELSIAPGDKKVVGSLVRESAAEEGAAAMAEEIAAKLKLEEEAAKAAAASKEEAAKAEAAAISKQRQRQDSMDDEAEAAKEAEERAAKKAAAAAAEAEKAAEEAEKAEKAKAMWKMAVEKVDINSIGFMALKQMLISKGVPPDAVKVPNKFMLKEVAAKHGVNIEWS